MEHRVIIAGCGNMSNIWFDYAAQRENIKIVGLVDVYEDAAKKMADKRKLNAPTFNNINDAITNTDANLVFDITIPEAHKNITITALQNGCHVFGEKPMAESLADAREVLDVAKTKNRHYSVMQNRRYQKKIRSLRHFIESGKIGEIGTINADFYLGAHFGGFRDAMEHPLVIDMAIHTFDAARFLSGADAISVYCHEFNPPGSWYEGDASAICIFEMSNGSVFTYRGSWCSEGFNTTWESDWRVIGSKGTAIWEGDTFPKAEVISNPSENSFTRTYQTIEIEETWNGREDHWGCLDEMFDALENGRLAETDCRDNIKSMEMIFGAIESSKTGKKVSFI